MNTSKQSSSTLKTPATVDTSQFMLATLGETEPAACTPTQFKSAYSSNMQTDEQGNRSSILPGSDRPSRAAARNSSSSIKISDPTESLVKKPAKKLTKAANVKSSTEPVEKKEVKKSAPTIKKPDQPKARTNFVKLNMNRNY